MVPPVMFPLVAVLINKVVVFVIIFTLVIVVVLYTLHNEAGVC